jgi:hypothetical protein
VEEPNQSLGQAPTLLELTSLLLEQIFAKSEGQTKCFCKKTVTLFQVVQKSGLQKNSLNSVANLSS